LLRNVTLVAGGAVALATMLTAQQAQAGNMTKQAAGYQETPHGDQKCESCALFQSPASCKFVAGDIAPAGWCRLYAKKSA
jgi:hypothetical protein